MSQTGFEWSFFRLQFEGLGAMNTEWFRHIHKKSQQNFSCASFIRTDVQSGYVKHKPLQDKEAFVQSHF